MKSKKIISIEPSTNILDVLSKSGYSLSSAICDVIDNSITAGASSIKVYIKLLDDKPYVAVIDNGNGMNEQKLEEAATLAYKNVAEERKSNDLGRYSMGLKSASMSFCNTLTIVSKSNNSEVNSVIIDFDAIRKNNVWNASIYNYNVSEFSIDEKGTIVLWNNLNDYLNDIIKTNEVYEEIDKVARSIGHTYNDFITNHEVSVVLNEHIIIGWDPFFTSNSKTMIIDEQKVQYKNSLIHVKSYILPVLEELSHIEKDYMVGKGLREQQGFYVYRNKRLISEGGWLELKDLKVDPKCDYARIRIDIMPELDKYFNVSFMKNSITLPLELHKKFIKIAQTARTSSRKNYNYVKNPELYKPRVKDREVPIWFEINTNKGIALSINKDHPLIIELVKGMKKPKINQLLQLISKSIPVGLIQSKYYVKDDMKNKDLMNLMSIVFQKFYREGKTISEIKSIMANHDPFSHNLDVLSDYFEGEYYKNE